MTIETHRLSVGDTLTPLGVQLKRLTTAGVYAAKDLSGLSVKFQMVAEDGTVVVAETADHTTVVDATTGKVQYDFQAEDVDTPGVYYAWFTVYNGSEKDTYPAGGRQFKIVIDALE